ncbi:MAG: hypothetical protein V3S92_05835 [Alphaproteobacteria bacterium]
MHFRAKGDPRRHFPKEIREHTYRQFQKRAQNRPLGLADWKAYLRLADRLDPSYKL